MAKKVTTKPTGLGKSGKLPVKKNASKRAGLAKLVLPLPGGGPTGEVLDRLWAVVMSRRDADPAGSHSARLLARGTAKVAQKFGEEAVECVIEAMVGSKPALIAESADVLYHLMVVWVNAGVRADEVWSELQRREGISGLAEKAGRAQKLAIAAGMRTRKIP